jgi:ribosomal protein S18 acetylase RimI-like enzyme
MGVIVRPPGPNDRTSVQRLLAASAVFTDEELRVAAELLEGVLHQDYVGFVAERDGEVDGYVCLGPTPLTEATWHLYWLGVHPRAQRRGLARALHAEAEARVRACRGARIVVETSGRPDYSPARRFYEGAGYRLAGRIADYYRQGDDCLFYCKTLDAVA